jgi:hypothetical protein
MSTNFDAYRAAQMVANEAIVAELTAQPSLYEARGSEPLPTSPPVVGLKYDGDKPRWGMLMGGLAPALAAVLEVLTFGARKYKEDSWQVVPKARERYLDALYRHLHAMECRGFSARDPETGLYEIQHVACNALFLCWFVVTNNDPK